MKIVTEHIFPPIPIRTHDWGAYYDDMGEDSPVGYGETEAEAIKDLQENWPMWRCPLCHQIMEGEADEVEGCEDYHCPARFMAETR